jgi:hypothetical protein
VAGLDVCLLPGGTKIFQAWLQRKGDKSASRRIELNSFPAVSVTEARKKIIEMKSVVREGSAPALEQRRARAFSERMESSARKENPQNQRAGACSCRKSQSTFPEHALKLACGASEPSPSSSRNKAMHAPLNNIVLRERHPIIGKVSVKSINSRASQCPSDAKRGEDGSRRYAYFERMGAFMMNGF